jgi:hypothetical protein
MPLKKASENKQRATLIRERIKARNTHYEMIKTVNFTTKTMNARLHIPKARFNRAI